MKAFVIGGLLLSVALAAASFAIGSESPDGLEKVLDEYTDAPPEAAGGPLLPRVLRGAAGTLLVFSIVVGLGSLKRRRRDRQT